MRATAVTTLRRRHDHNFWPRLWNSFDFHKFSRKPNSTHSGCPTSIPVSELSLRFYMYQNAKTIQTWFALKKILFWAQNEREGWNQCTKQPVAWQIKSSNYPVTYIIKSRIQITKRNQIQSLEENLRRLASLCQRREYWIGTSVRWSLFQGPPNKADSASQSLN